MGVAFDNLDRGAAGTVAVITFFLFFITYDRQQALVSALFLGIIILVLTIRLSPGVVPQIKSFAIPLSLMEVPILDTTVAVTSRLYRGISPFQGGTDHLSHRLMRVGRILLDIN